MPDSSSSTERDVSAVRDVDTSAFAWTYAPAPERHPLTTNDRYGLFINGAFREPRSQTFFESINPSTGQVLTTVAEADASDVDEAVESARKAQRRWARLRPQQRASHLFRLARRIQERSRELATLESTDGGKPIRESRDMDLPLVAQHFFYHAGWCDKLRYVSGRVGVSSSGGRNGGHPAPIGVCGQIIPWNFPLLMAAWKLAPALACGNACVLKPAETTSLTALRLAEILQEIDFPPGVVNIVTGAGETGRHLVEHPKVDKIAFTGSTEVGKLIARTCAGSKKRLTLELGGKSPNIIFDDASIDQATEGIIRGIFFNQGHVCCAGSRLFVQESILDEVIEKLEARMATLIVGDPLDKNTDIGAINSDTQLETIARYLAIGEHEGATLHVSGTPGGAMFATGSGRPTTTTDAASAPGPGPVLQDRNGYWCRPCFFTGVQPSHTIAREEIFGPVLAVMSFRTPEEAIERANNTPYGLSAGIWTDKGSKVFEVARRLKAGVVWCNTFNMFDASSPFGGFKESGFGREGGLHGLRAYLR